MNYYNEFDAGAAAWLRELIARQLIPQGEVDERSITDVEPGDLAGFTQCHFFAGIGGWPLALQLAGWPADRPVWTGSCPCQPFSAAGKRKGNADERHLWPAFFRIIRECRPDAVFGEQVEGAVGHGWLDGICADLEGENYACGSVVLGAHSVGSPHIRQRLYWVAESTEQSLGGRSIHRPGEGAGAAGERAPDQPGGCGGAGWLSHASSARPQEFIGGRQQPEGLAAPSGAGGLQHTNCARPQPWQPATSPAGFRSAIEPTGGAGGLQHAAGDGREQGRTESGGRRIERGCCIGGLGDSEGERRGWATDNENSGRRECALADSGAGDFWSNFDILPFRDGKARRVESMSQSMVDGISGAMVLLRNLSDKEKEEITNATYSESLRNEIMRALRCGHAAEEVWVELGRYCGVPESTVLLAFMCQQSRELGEIIYGAASRCRDAQGGSMRDLQHATQQTTCASQRWRLSKQLVKQLADTLPELSQKSSHWQTAIEAVKGFDGYPLAVGVKARVMRLKGYGNAIVPQVAAEFIKAYMEGDTQ